MDLTLSALVVHMSYAISLCSNHPYQHKLAATHTRSKYNIPQDLIATYFLPECYKIGISLVQRQLPVPQ